MNFEFAVDLESHANRKSGGSETESGEQSNFYRQRSASACARLLSHNDVHIHKVKEHSPSNEAFDTFEQCLHVCNEIESIMAYHYWDETDTKSYRFEEIYPVRNDADLRNASQALEQFDRNSTSLENLEKLKRHLDGDIEKFLHERFNILRKEKEIEEMSS